MSIYQHDLGGGERFRAQAADKSDEWWFYGRTVQDWGQRYPVTHYVPCEPALWAPETGWVRLKP